LLDLFGCPQDINPGVRTLRFLLGADRTGPPPSAPEIRSLLTPMPVDQLRAVASLLSLDLPSGRWSAPVRGAKVVNPLVSLSVRVFAAHQAASALPLPVRGVGLPKRHLPTETVTPPLQGTPGNRKVKPCLRQSNGRKSQ